MASATIGDASMPPAHELTVSRPSLPALALPRVAVRHRVALAVLGLTALSFLLPAAPTYDPWAWIIWGREIMHLDLSTVDGPSWKPLPVLLTTPFSLFGGLAPDLWLFVARAGAIAGVVMLFRLGRRFGGITAGVAAAVPYALASWTIRNGALGNSEGLLVALALGAVERHLEGRRGTAFALALGAALLRPEAWPFFGLYGLWLLWREPSLRRWVVLAFAALPALWLLPEWWGSGDLLRAAHRAQNPLGNTPAFAKDPSRPVPAQFERMLPQPLGLGPTPPPTRPGPPPPVRAVLDQFERMLPQPLWLGRIAHPIELGLAALGGAAVVRVLRRDVARHDLLVVAALLAGALLWVLEVALMTSDGFSGNVRYLVMPAALVFLGAGIGAGWAVRAVLGARLSASLPLGLALGALVVFAFVWPARDALRADHDALVYQARLADRVPALVARAGGADRLRACGEIYTGPVQVPLVAWNLHMHTTLVHSTPPIRPAVVFRAKSTPPERPGPSLRSLGDPSDLRTLATAPHWRIVAACRGAA